ncbi:hypothetical protein ACFRU3_45965, partial [Streptomyces sp. NPDC056910]|uniref:hypothetical protein n=1 Tax=Streptomyces sp. NPDC056910 TaxID=3345964 RepID=UPI00367708DD
YSATASARNSGEYFDVPNGNSCPMDHHDPMIKVSTLKGKRPWDERRRIDAEQLRLREQSARDLLAVP